MSIDIRVSIAVIALIAVCQALMQLAIVYPQHSGWMGALSAALLLIANKLPAAFERKPNPTAIEIPKVGDQ